jgi:basic membrane lipoprotein Med (substrate-binding protein (PBP1-ABC) superfamily)
VLEQELAFPESRGATVVGAVVTNDLDADDYNALIGRTAKNYHNAKLGGKITEPARPKKNKPNQEVPRGGWIEPDPFAGTNAVTEATLDIAGREDPDYIIVSGGDWASGVGIARTNPSTAILAINAPAPCLDENGRADPTRECANEDARAPGNYRTIEFAVEEGAYLAGVVAARESRGQPLGIIAGALDCLECDRYVTGFITGARSVEPDIEIVLQYLADDEVAGFGDEASAKTYAETFIEVYQPGVLLPVGRGAVMGMVEAACEAEIKVIGAGVDVSAERPDFRQSCVVASIVPDVARAVEESLYLWSTPSEAGDQIVTYDLAQGGIRLTDEWFSSPTKRVDTNEFFDTAKLAIETDQVDACPDGCGVFAPEPETEEALAS